MKAFVFPGQGAQFVGMGKDLYEKYEKVKEIFDKAVEILGYDIRKLCFEGPEDELTNTRNAQPAIFLHSSAMLQLINEKPDITAGHSLGEYTALYCAGVFDFETALKVVAKRGELMAKAGEKAKGKMSAVIGLSIEKIEKILSDLSKKGVILIANYNSPQQVVISGEEKLIEEANEILKKEGAKRVIPLKVSAAFHSPLMDEAGREFAQFLDRVEFREPEIPVVPNATAKVTKDVKEIKDALKKQMTSKVLWIQSVEEMIKWGVKKFCEIGPGRVLTGLIKKIAPEVEVEKIEL